MYMPVSNSISQSASHSTGMLSESHNRLILYYENLIAVIFDETL